MSHGENQISEIEKRIRSGFIRLLEKKPIEQVSVVDICAAAGVSKRSFYNYFCDKYDVILRVQTIPETDDADAAVSLSTLEDYFRRRYRWLLEHRGFVRNVSLYFGQNSSVLAFKDSVIALLWKIMKQNRPDLQETKDLTYAVNCFAYGYILFVIEIILRDPDYCMEYFSREHFILDHVPTLLREYLAPDRPAN